ncbi:hypothetical protein QQ045_002159 [Rhodiola kirilowii]
MIDRQEVFSVLFDSRLSGLGLNGNMGYSLSNLMSVTTLDVSANSIDDSIPYQFPPNLTALNTSHDSLT